VLVWNGLQLKRYQAINCAELMRCSSLRLAAILSKLLDRRFSVTVRPRQVPGGVGMIRKEPEEDYYGIGAHKYRS
jgi:hypothetical protein